MKKYAILAIAVVLAVLLTAASADAFSFKFFKPAIKIAKVAPTSTANAPAQNNNQGTIQGSGLVKQDQALRAGYDNPDDSASHQGNPGQGQNQNQGQGMGESQSQNYGESSTSNAPAQSSGFCGQSVYDFCSNNNECHVIPGGGSCQSAPGGQGSGGPLECSDGQKYGLKCGCLNNQCQWAKAWSWYESSQGQGQGTSQSQGQGNGQSSQGQQGQGMGESQSQGQGEGSSFQCLNLPEEKKCIDSEGIHQYCTGADGCYTKHNYNCKASENGIQKCVAGGAFTVCLPSC